MCEANSSTSTSSTGNPESLIEQREDGLYEKSTGRKIVSPLDLNFHILQGISKKGT